MGATTYARVLEAFELARERRMPLAAATRERGISARDFYACVSAHPELNGIWARLKGNKPRVAGNAVPCVVTGCEAGRSPSDARFCQPHRDAIRAFWIGLREDLAAGRIGA